VYPGRRILPGPARGGGMSRRTPLPGSNSHVLAGAGAALALEAFFAAFFAIAMRKGMRRAKPLRTLIREGRIPVSGQAAAHTLPNEKTRPRGCNTPWEMESGSQSSNLLIERIAAGTPPESTLQNPRDCPPARAPHYSIVLRLCLRKCDFLEELAYFLKQYTFFAAGFAPRPGGLMRVLGRTRMSRPKGAIVHAQRAF